MSKLYLPVEEILEKASVGDYLLTAHLTKKDRNTVIMSTSSFVAEKPPETKVEYVAGVGLYLGCILVGFAIGKWAK